MVFSGLLSPPPLWAAIIGSFPSPTIKGLFSIFFFGGIRFAIRINNNTEIIIDEKTIAFGEIGLSGEVRSVSRPYTRIKEAARLGFTKCIVPKSALRKAGEIPDGIKVIGVSSLREAINNL